MKDKAVLKTEKPSGKQPQVVPKHIAFIMDGNGRWAKRRLLPRSAGHRQGVKNVIKVAEAAFDMGVEVVSLFAFSTENWSRPKDERDTLFELLKSYFEDNLKRLIDKGVRIEIMGDITAFPIDLQEIFKRSIDTTRENTANILNIGINYGGRDEIIRAVNKLLERGAKSTSKEDFNNCLYTKNLPDPDLIIRTSGEQRLSNFMLYQAAYSELYFSKTLWPDFTKTHLKKAILEYGARNRRFGGV